MLKRVFRKFAITCGVTLGLTLLAPLAGADGAGVITDVHYSVFDSNQTSNICFEVNGVFLAFSSNGSDEAKVVESLIVSAYVAGRPVSYQSSASAIGSAPCQAWDISSPVYQLLSIAFQ